MEQDEQQPVEVDETAVDGGASAQPNQTLSLDEAYDRIAANYGVPTTVWRAMVRQESGGNTRAVSGAGARGAWQIMPDTFRGLGYDPKTDYNDPLKVAEGGLRLLRNSYKKYRPKARDEAHAWQMSIAAYHAGEGAVDANLKRGGDGIPNTYDRHAKITTRQHVAKIFSNVDSTQLTRNPVSGTFDASRQSYEVPPIPYTSEPGFMPPQRPPRPQPTPAPRETELSPMDVGRVPPPPPRTSQGVPSGGRLTSSALPPLPQMNAPRTAEQLTPPPPQPPTVDGLPYIPPTVGYFNVPSEGALTGVEVPAGAGAGTEGAGVTPQVETPGAAQQVTDTRGNTYELDASQKGLPGKGRRWRIISGPDANLVIEGAPRTSYIEQNGRLVLEDEIQAERRALQNYVARDRDIAKRFGTGIVVYQEGVDLTPDHLRQLTEGNPRLRQRVERLIQQPTMGPPTAGPRKVRIPWALQAALELERQGIKFGVRDPEAFLREQAQKGKLKFRGNELAIGPEALLSLLDSTRPTRFKAANRFLKEIAEKGADAYSPQFWQGVDESVGLNTFGADDPRLPFAVSTGERARIIRKQETEKRVAELEPLAKNAAAEAKQALLDPNIQTSFGNAFDFARLRRTDQGTRDEIAEIMGGIQAGLIDPTEGKKAIEELFKAGNANYERARTEVARRGFSVEGAAPEGFTPLTDLDDAKFQDYIARTQPVLSAEQRAAIREEYKTKPSDLSTSPVGMGILQAGRSVNSMLLGALEGVLPTQAVRSWRATIEAGAEAGEGVRERAERKGTYKNLTQTAVQAVGEIPRFILMTKTGMGLPQLLAVDGMLQARGEGASDEEVLKAGAMGAATGAVFYGAGKLAAPIVKELAVKGTPTLGEFAKRVSAYAKENPEFAQRISAAAQTIARNRQAQTGLVRYGSGEGVGKVLTPDEELKVLFDAMSKADLKKLRTPAERRWAIASAVAGPLVQMPIVYEATRQINLIGGASEERAKEEAIANVILDLGMAYGPKIGLKGLDALDAGIEKLKGKWFRVKTGAEVTDVAIDPQGRFFRPTAPLDRQLVEAEIVVDPEPGATPGPETGPAPEAGGRGVEQVPTETQQPTPSGPIAEAEGIARPTWEQGKPTAGMKVTRTFLEPGKTKKGGPELVNREGEIVEGPDGDLYVEYDGPDGKKREKLRPNSFSPEPFKQDNTKTGTWFLNEGQEMPPPPTEEPPVGGEGEAPAPKAPKGKKPTGKKPPVAVPPPGEGALPEGPTPTAPKGKKAPAGKKPTELAPPPPKGAPKPAKGTKPAPPKRGGKTPPPPPDDGGAPPPAGTEAAPKPPATPKTKKPTEAIGKPVSEPPPAVIPTVEPPPAKKPKGKQPPKAAPPEEPPTTGGEEGGAPKPQPPAKKPVTKAAVTEKPSRKEFKVDVPDGETPARKIADTDKPALPNVDDIPDIVRGKGTDKETSSRETARQLTKALDESIKEYNKTVDDYNKALEAGDDQIIVDSKPVGTGKEVAKRLAKDLQDTADRIKDQIRRLNNLKEGRRSWDDGDGKRWQAEPRAEEAPKPKAPAKEAIIDDEDLAPPAPKPAKPTERLKLQPVPGRKPKVGDTVYKASEYAEGGFFEGKVVKSRSGQGFDVVYENKRLGRKRRESISSAWSTEKPVPPTEGGKKAPETPTPEQKPAEKPKQTKQQAAEEKKKAAAEKKKQALEEKKRAAEEKKQATEEKKKAAAEKKKQAAEEKKKAAEKPKAKAEEPTPKPPVETPKAKDNADVVAQKEADLQAMKDRLDKAVDNNSRVKLQQRIDKLAAEIAKLKGEEVPTEGGRRPAPREPQAPPQPQGPIIDVIDPTPPKGKRRPEDLIVEQMDPNLKADIRHRIDNWRRGKDEGMSPKDISEVYGIPLKVVEAIPEKGDLGPFGQVSYKLRGWMEDPSTSFLEEMARILEPRADLSNRPTAANVIMDKLADIIGRPRSSTLSRDDWSKLYAELIPKLSDDSALKILEAGEWQSKYSTAIRDLQTNPQWRALIDGLRNELATSWSDISPQRRRDLLVIARAVGVKYGPRPTKGGGEANIFTDAAIARAFNETLARRNRPLFEPGISAKDIEEFANRLQEAREGRLDSLDRNNPNRTFDVDTGTGTVFYRREPQTRGFSADPDTISRRVDELRSIGVLDAAAAAQVAVEIKALNATKDRILKSINNQFDLVKGMDWRVSDDGVVFLNFEGAMFINYVADGHPTAALGVYTRRVGQGMDRKVERLALNARLLHADGRFDDAEKVWQLAAALQKAADSSIYGDYIWVLDTPEAPTVNLMTLQEEILHRADYRSREGAKMANLTGAWDFGQDVDKVSINWLNFGRLPAVKKARRTLIRAGYSDIDAVINTEAIAKALRNDAEDALGITSDERWEIVKQYAKVLVDAKIDPAIVHLNFSGLTPRADQFTQYYAKQYELAHPAEGGRRRKVKLTAHDARLRKIWEQWVGPNARNPKVSAKYRPRVRNVKVNGESQTIIDTPNLKGRKVERVVKHDGQYLRSENNPEIKLTPEEIKAIEDSDDSQRPYMEDAIYAADINESPMVFDFGGKKVEFSHAESANLVDWGRAMDRPEQWKALSGLVGKGTWGALTIWNSAKIAIRASMDLSSFRQNMKLIASAKPWYRDFNAQGKAALQLNRKLDAQKKTLLEQEKTILDRLGDPAKLAILAKQGMTEAKLRTMLSKVQSDLKTLESQYVTINKSMTELRMKNLLFSHIGSTLGGLKERDWRPKVFGVDVADKIAPGRFEGKIPAMEYFAKRMWSDPNYKLFKEIGLDYGAIMKPEKGSIVTDGFNTGEVITVTARIKGTPKAPDAAQMAAFYKRNPETTAKFTYNPKSRMWEAEVLRVKKKNGQNVPLTFDWRVFGPETKASYEMFGSGIISRAPWIESKYGRRTLSEAIASGNTDNMLGWFATKGRLAAYFPIKSSQNAYDTSTAWLRHREMTAQIRELRVKYALEGKKLTKDDLRKAAERINRLTGAFSGDASTKKGQFINNAILPVMQQIMFSARWQGSLLSLFAPAQYMTAPKHVRYETRRGAAQGLGVFITALAMLGAVTDADVVYDSPTDPGFVRLRFLGKSVDISGGVAKTAIYLSRITKAFYGYMFGDEEGETLYDKPKKIEDPLSAFWGITLNALTKTLNPRAQDIYAGLKQETVMGEPTTFTEHFLKTWVPITVGNTLDAYMTGTFGSSWTALETVGIGVNDLETPEQVEEKRLADWDKYEYDPELQASRDKSWKQRYDYTVKEENRRLERQELPPWSFEAFLESLEIDYEGIGETTTGKAIKALVGSEEQAPATPEPPPEK